MLIPGQNQARRVTSGKKTMIEKILDDAKAITGSDRQTALRIGYDVSQLYGWRANRRPVPVEAATKLAQLVGRNPFQVICEVEAAQARSEESRKYWASLRRHAAAAAIALVMTGNIWALVDGGPCRNRTDDQRIKSPMLYRLS